MGTMTLDTRVQMVKERVVDYTKDWPPVIN